MSYPPGTVLKRREPKGDALDEIKVVGGGKDSMSVASNSEFGQVFPLDAATARKEYTAEDEAGEQFLSVPGYIQPGQTPEEIFAQEQREHPPGPNKGREALRRNAETEAVTGTPQPAPTVEEVADQS